MAEKKSKLAVIKTKPTEASAQDFINGIKDEQKRKDSFVILEMMRKAIELAMLSRQPAITNLFRYVIN